MSTTVVNITFKRIQQFLFAVPRLKAMIGANALLGEVIRKDLVEAVNNHNPKEVTSVSPPGKDKDDPLNDDNTPLNNDDPEGFYKQGILSRDGGHFTAVFQSEEDAREFVASAQNLVMEKLPGVMIEAVLKTDGRAGDKQILTENEYGETPTRLPQFQICEDTGDEIANIERNETPNYISSKVKKLERAADQFRQGESQDIIGKLLSIDKLPGVIKQERKLGEEKDKPGNIPKDLKALAGNSGYIAVIHADGNSMGLRRKIYAEGCENETTENNDEEKNEEKTFVFKDFIAKEVKNEQFFHAMRVAVRKSVIKALNNVFTDEVLKRHKKLPYQLLMLGGDDLLLITRPEYAFPFVIEYSKALKDPKIPYKDGELKKEISIGAGIAIAHHNVPFYHLHHLAENLASSAKKLYRSQQAEKDETPEERSVVDWMVATTSWIDNIEKTRLHYDLNDNATICTTAKPYFVLPEDTTSGEKVSEVTDTFCLDTLWNSAKAIANRYRSDESTEASDANKLPRSRFKALLRPVSAFEIGKSQGYFNTIEPMPDELTELFGKEGKQFWHDIGGKTLTQYKDLMELVEAHFLGQQTKSSSVPEEEPESEKNDEENKGGRPA